MGLSNELIEKAKQAKSVEELLEMAKAENIELTAEEAAKAFAKLNASGELSDEELDNVAGGCGGEEIPEPKYNIGDMVVSSKGFPCHTCGYYRDFQITKVHRSPDGKHTILQDKDTIGPPQRGTVEWEVSEQGIWFKN